MSYLARAPNTDFNICIVIERQYQIPLISHQGSGPEHPRSHSWVPPGSLSAGKALLKVRSQPNGQSQAQGLRWTGSCMRLGWGNTRFTF